VRDGCSTGCGGCSRWLATSRPFLCVAPSGTETAPPREYPARSAQRSASAACLDGCCAWEHRPLVRADRSCRSSPASGAVDTLSPSGNPRASFTPALSRGSTGGATAAGRGQSVVTTGYGVAAGAGQGGRCVEDRQGSWRGGGGKGRGGWHGAGGVEGGGAFRRSLRQCPLHYKTQTGADAPRCGAAGGLAGLSRSGPCRWRSHCFGRGLWCVHGTRRCRLRAPRAACRVVRAAVGDGRRA